eukprot:gene52959-70808_t
MSALLAGVRLAALSLLVWYVFAPQCISTLAAVKRETGSWRYVWIMAGYLFALAYMACFITYRVAVALGAEEEMAQQLIVGFIVAAAAFYAVWRWMPAGWRRGAAQKLAAGTHRAGWVDEERAR